MRPGYDATIARLTFQVRLRDDVTPDQVRDAIRPMTARSGLSLSTEPTQATRSITLQGRILAVNIFDRVDGLWDELRFTLENLAALAAEPFNAPEGESAERYGTRTWGSAGQLARSRTNDGQQAGEQQKGSSMTSPQDPPRFVAPTLQPFHGPRKSAEELELECNYIRSVTQKGGNVPEMGPGTPEQRKQTFVAYCLMERNHMLRQGAHASAEQVQHCLDHLLLSDLGYRFNQDLGVWRAADPKSTAPSTIADGAPRFYKTDILVEVLSERPYTWGSLGDVLHDINDGPCVGRVTEAASKELDARQAADELIAMGSEPGYFDIDDVDRAHASVPGPRG